MNNQATPFEYLLNSVSRTAMDICLKGWAERNAGNISIRLRQDEISSDFRPFGDKCPLGVVVPQLAGEHFLITSTGSYMRNVPLKPSEYLGVIRIDELGTSYRTVWGFERKNGPTSELPAHIMAHSSRIAASNGADRVVIHTHAFNIIALTNAMTFDSTSITRLLWETHSECIVVFPDGIEILPWLVPGSDELGIATANALETRRMAIWPIHGIIATGPDLDAVFGLIDTADKAAAIYMASSFNGLPKNKLTQEQLESIAASFGLRPDSAAMNI